MGRLIDADVLKDELNAWARVITKPNLMGSDEVMCVIDHAPTIDAVPSSLLDQNTKRCELLRKQLREAHENYEKHLNELQAKLDEAENSIKNYKDLYLSRKREELLLAQQIPKHGEWIMFERPNGGYYKGCSLCTYPMPTDMELDYLCEEDNKYCYNCGAKMDGKEKDDG